jgi:hypothetical protein
MPLHKEDNDDHHDAKNNYKMRQAYRYFYIKFNKYYVQVTTNRGNENNVQ